AASAADRRGDRPEHPHGRTGGAVKWALWPVQRAVYQRLTSHAPLMARVTGVLDDVPEGQPFPYVTLGEWTEIPRLAFGEDGSETTATLHVWSRYRGWKECSEIVALMNEVLDDAELEVEGYRTVLVVYDSSTAIRDTDGMPRHMVDRYRLILEELEA